MSDLRCDDPNDWDEVDGDDWCETCQNLGSFPCDCGGDICVCENNGEEPCPDCQF